MVGAVFDYICENVVYDKEKAQAVQTTTGYMPVLDDTLRTGKGICFDYASLVAGMLRSQGIPTKMVFGDVSPDDIYHAWNMFYTEETGWVTVKASVSACMITSPSSKGPPWPLPDLSNATASSIWIPDCTIMAMLSQNALTPRLSSFPLSGVLPADGPGRGEGRAAGGCAVPARTLL